MKNLSEVLYKFRRLFLFLLVFVVITISGFFIYRNYLGFHITAKFSDATPLFVKMPVYYKGYNIGFVNRIKPSKDYEYSYVKIVFYSQKPNLPENITAKIKLRETKSDYIELIKPDEPSENKLKNKAVIEGEAAFDLFEFLSNIYDSGALDPIIESVTDFVSSISSTSDEIGSFFSDSRTILKDNKKNIRKTTTSLNQITSKVNNSINESQLNSTFSNISNSASNIEETSENIKNATENLDITKNKLDCTISDIQSSASNIKNVTEGVCQTMNKRFAGLRLIFGKPSKKDCCTKGCGKNN